MQHFYTRDGEIHDDKPHDVVMIEAGKRSSVLSLDDAELLALESVVVRRANALRARLAPAPAPVTSSRSSRKRRNR